MERPEPSNVLELFWGLSSIDEEERIKSAHRLVVGVKNLQESDEDVDGTVQYCLQRLVRGLASNRKGARQGFFIALCEILSIGRGTEVSAVLSLVRKHLEQIGNAKAQEERGACFGLAFALLALIQSDLLKRPEDVAAVTEHLVAAAGKNVHLGEFVGVGIVRLLQSVPEEVVLGHLLPKLELDCGWEGCSPDKLLVLAQLQKTVGKTEQYRQLLGQFWGCERIHDPKNFKAVATVLMQSSESHPRVHDVWPAMLELIDDVHFAEFWMVAVDEGLLASTHKRRYLAFKLVEWLLPTTTVSRVGVVLSPSLLRCLGTNVSSSDNFLHKAASRLLHVLPEVVSRSKDPGLSVAVCLCMLEISEAKYGFVPGSNILNQLKEKVTPAGIRLYVEQVLRNKGAIVPERVQLMMKHFARHKSVGWLLPLAQNLLLLSQFVPVKACPPLIMTVPDDDLVVDRESLSQKLTSVLTSLSSLRRSAEHVSGCAADERPDGTEGEWFVALVTSAQALIEAGEEAAILLHPFCEEHFSIWQEAVHLVRSLDDRLPVKEKVFLPLICTATLQLLLESQEDSRNSMADVVKDLLACHADMTSFVVETPARRKGRGRRAATLPESKWVEVLVDLMLGLLSRPQQLWRNVIDRTFSHLLPSMTSEAVQLIAKALEPQAVNELMESDEDQSYELEGRGDGSRSENPASPEGCCAYDKVRFHNVDAELRAEVQRALGSLAAYDSDQESVSDSSLDDEQMMAVDDALGEVFHKRLRDTASSRKKQRKMDDKTVMHFKMRVLDLVEVFINRGSQNPLLLELLQPLLRLAVDSRTKKKTAAATLQSPLADKVVEVLHKLTHVRTYPREGLDAMRTHVLLESAVKHLFRANKLTAPWITNICLFLVRVLRGSRPRPLVSPMATRSARKRRQSERERAAAASPQFGALEVDRVVEWLSKALHHMITNKNSSVPMSFFQALLQRQPELSWLLFPTLVTSLSSAGNRYRKLQAFELGSSLLSLKNVPDEMTVSAMSAWACDLQLACLTELRSAAEGAAPSLPPSTKEQGRSKRARPALVLLDKLAGRLNAREELRELIMKGELSVHVEEMDLVHLASLRAVLLEKS